MDIKKNNIESKYGKVRQLLENLQLLEAMAIIKELLTIAGLNKFIDRLNKDEETFRYLLHYMIQGSPDPSREKVVGEISDRLLMLADLAVRSIKGKDSSDYYFEAMRFAEYKKEDLGAIIKEYGTVISELGLIEATEGDDTTVRKLKEDLLERLFNVTMTSLGDEKGYHELGKYLLSGYADKDFTLISLSAITLSLLFFYDKNKLRLLVEMFESISDPAVQARAIAGIVIALSIHSNRIGKDSELKSRLSLWEDSIDYYSKLRQTIRIFVGTRDTDRITSKIKDEVLPELMKLRPEIMNKLKDSATKEIDAEFLQNNPEWEELLEKNGISGKMQELAEMQSEGADLMMVTFSNLKQFPFFNKAVNWFLPFDVKNTSLSVPAEFRSVLAFMQASGNLICDSDLYSLALASAHMPTSQRDMVMSQLNMQQTQINMESEGEELKSSTLSFDKEVQKTVRDLYRFFKLFRKRQGFINPFDRPLPFYEFPVLGSILRDEEVLELIGEFYFKRGFYKDALPILQILSSSEPDNVALHEKIGFCLQSVGKMPEALEEYNKASLLKTPGIWLLKKLALMNRLTGHISEAIGYYKSILEKEPENFSVMVNVANLLVDERKYDEALHHYYHAHYLRPSTPRVMRGIAWAELLNGNIEKSLDYYEKVIAMEGTLSDYLNMGHASLLKKANKDALNYYRIAFDINSEEFDLAFNADIPMLEEKGISFYTALLFLEAVKNK